jgi:hypothetical protein
MRIILILIVIAVIFAVIQSKRHGCEWGEDGWFDCVIGKTASEMPGSTPASTPEAPTSEEPATETP